MANVVLDEWVLIRGLNAEQPGAGFERECAELLSLVQERHRWVVSEALIDVYQRRVYHASYKGAIWGQLLRSLQQSIIDPARALWLRTVPTIEGAYDTDDVAWVSAAAAAPAACLLVTGDRRLLAQLAAGGLPERHGFAACFVTEALARLAP